MWAFNKSCIIGPKYEAQNEQEDMAQYNKLTHSSNLPFDQINHAFNAKRWIRVTWGLIYIYNELYTKFSGIT